MADTNLPREKSLFMETGKERGFLFNRGERKLNKWNVPSHPLSYSDLIPEAFPPLGA